MRRPIPVLILVLLLASAVAAVEPEQEPVRRAVVAVERARHLLREAMVRPDRADHRKVRRALRDLEASLSATPWRGEATGLLRQLDEAAAGGGGMLPRDRAVELEERLSDLSGEMRRLLALRMRHPPRDEGDLEEEALLWRERLATVMREEAIGYEREEESFFETALHRIGAWVGWLLGWLFGGKGAAPATWLALRVGATLVLAVGLCLLLLRALRSSRQRREVPSGPPPPEPLAERGAPWSAAVAAARRGRLDEAVRRGWLHLLSLLERGPSIPSTRTLTNGEVIAEARGGRLHAESRTRLARAAAVFDAIRYGERLARGEDWAEFQEAAAPLREELADGGEEEG